MSELMNLMYFSKSENQPPLLTPESKWIHSFQGKFDKPTGIVKLCTAQWNEWIRANKQAVKHMHIDVNKLTLQRIGAETQKFSLLLFLKSFFTINYS